MNPTLKGGQPLAIILEPLPNAPADAPPRAESVFVRQIKVRDYDAGFAFINDEVALVGFLIGKTKEQALDITPESYEEILTLGKAVNEKGFFSSCRRRIEVQQQRESQAAMALAQLPADARDTLLNAAAQLTGLTSSPASSSSPPRPRA